MIFDPVSLLKEMIAVPSVSRQEDGVADLIASTLDGQGIPHTRKYNNVLAVHPGYDESKPTLLLNSHIDTVRPAKTWTRDPFSPDVIEGKLYGLGSNDAGASVVSLMAAFIAFWEKELPFNLLLGITAEEEVMDVNGMRAFLPFLSESGYRVDMALVGEPTSMQPAIGERGLLVLDCVSRGVSGHAARNEGVNAIYKAMTDIERLRSYRFPEESEVLGPVGIAVTQISAGSQHNVVPDECRWVVDVRTTDAYDNPTTVEMLKQIVDSEMTPRSTRVWASVIDRSHPLVRAAVMCGGTPFVSPTTSDRALMHNIPALKIGPGESSRSHTADEFVMLSEISGAVEGYIRIIENLSNIIK